MKALKQFGSWLKVTLLKLTNATEKVLDKYVPIAVKVTNALKEAMDSGKVDSIAAIVKIPLPAAGDAVVDTIVVLYEKWIPKIAMAAGIIESIIDVEDPKEQLRMVFEKIAAGIPEDQRQKFLSQITTQVAYDLSAEDDTPGKITWGEVAAYVEITYKQLKG